MQPAVRAELDLVPRGKRRFVPKRKSAVGCGSGDSFRSRVVQIFVENGHLDCDKKS